MKKVISIACAVLAFLVPQLSRAQFLLGAPFSFQGHLNDAGAPANGTYEIKFDYFDAPSGGPSLGSLFDPFVQVDNGIFTEVLNASTSFLSPGRSVYIEISVRPAGSASPLTILAPRHRILSAPYAITSLRSADADRLGGLTADQYLTISGAGFTMSGTGAANVFNAATQYDLGGVRILSAGGADNIFAGFGAGASGTTGASNAFFGALAGNLNTTGQGNAFFGRTAGRNNIGGNANAFFGNSAGLNNATGGHNAFFGADAGSNNTTGGGNTTVGEGANVGAPDLINASAFGWRAYVTQNDSLVLGSIGGVNGAMFSAKIGIGTTAPTFPLHVSGGSKALRVQATGGTVASFGPAGVFQVDATAVAGGRFNILENGNVGIGTNAPTQKLHVVGENIRIESPSPSLLPRFSINSATAATDKKKWQNYATATALNFTALNDAEAAETFWMQVNRGVGTAITNVVFPSGNIGIGNVNPSERLQVNGSTAVSGRLTVNGGIDYFDTAGNANFFMKGVGAANGINFGVVGNVGSNSTLFVAQYDGTTYQDRLVVDLNGVVIVPSKIVAGASAPTAGSLVKLEVGGFMSTGLDASGTTAVCRNASSVLSFCSSSIRYKQNVQDYMPGIDLVRRLRPVSFNWKSSNEADFGLVAEEVANVEPRMITRNDRGEVEGVKYDRVGVVLLNAVGEQQTQLEAQQVQIEAQQKQLDEQSRLIRSQRETLERQQSQFEALTAAVCATGRGSEICREQRRRGGN